MSAEAGNLGKVEAELVVQPVHGITRPTGEDANKVVSCEFTSLARRNETTLVTKANKSAYGSLGVLEENFGVVGNPCLLLGLCTCAVDAGGSFGGVTTHEPEEYGASAHPMSFRG